MPSCSTTNSNSKPTSALNCLRLKYHCRISSTSVSAFQTRPTGALKVRSITTASAKSCFVVMVFVQSTGICVWLDNTRELLELPAEDIPVKRLRRFGVVGVNLKVSHAIHVGSFVFFRSVPHLVSPPLEEARAARSCTSPGRSSSVVFGSSCQIHHSYVGVWG